MTDLERQAMLRDLYQASAMLMVQYGIASMCDESDLAAEIRAAAQLVTAAIGRLRKPNAELEAS